RAFPTRFEVSYASPQGGCPTRARPECLTSATEPRCGRRDSNPRGRRPATPAPRLPESHPGGTSYGPPVCLSRTGCTTRFRVRGVAGLANLRKGRPRITICGQIVVRGFVQLRDVAEIPGKTVFLLFISFRGGEQNLPLTSPGAGRLCAKKPPQTVEKTVAKSGNFQEGLLAAKSDNLARGVLSRCEALDLRRTGDLRRDRRRRRAAADRFEHDPSNCTPRREGWKQPSKVSSARAFRRDEPGLRADNCASPSFAPAPDTSPGRMALPVLRKAPAWALDHADCQSGAAPLARSFRQSPLVSRRL